MYHLLFAHELCIWYHHFFHSLSSLYTKQQLHDDDTRRSNQTNPTQISRIYDFISLKNDNGIVCACVRMKNTQPFIIE